MARRCRETVNNTTSSGHASLSMPAADVSATRDEAQHAQSNPSDVIRLRLNALTVAGLTGTPHWRDGASAAGFFKRVSDSVAPKSPAGSVDTLRSIQHSSNGDEGKSEDGGSSVLSEELGEIVFTDEEGSSESENSGRKIRGDDRRGGGGGGSAPSCTNTAIDDARCAAAGEVRLDVEGSGGGKPAGPAPTASQWGKGGGSVGVAKQSDARKAPPWPPVATTAAEAAPAHFGAAPEVEHGDRALPPADGGVDARIACPVEASSLLPASRSGRQTRPLAEEDEHRQRRRDATLSPGGSRTHYPLNARSGPTPPTGQAYRCNQHQQHQQMPHIYPRSSDGGATEIRGGCSADVSINMNGRDTRSTLVASSAVSGADSGGGGVSHTPAPQALPSGTAVPTMTCKILVVGNAKCGKSSIISRFVSNRFSSDYHSTVGADYAMKDVSLQGGRQVRLQLWDIAGQDRFAKLTRAYFRRAKGAVVVCDVTREGTFDAIVRWKDEIDLWCQNEECELPVFLLANKCDLLTEVQDSFLAGARMEKTCRDSGFAGWYITSAKRGDNIITAMTDLLERALEADDRRNRARERRRPSPGGGSKDADNGSASQGKAFQLSSWGRRETEGQGWQHGACCA